MYEENPNSSAEYREPPKRDPLSTASLVFGILSLLSSLIIYTALPFGALAVIFALLSRTDKPMAKKSRIGIVCGICGMIATVVITVSSVFYVLNDSSMRALLEEYIQIYTGDFDFSLGDTLDKLLTEPLEGGILL